MQIHKRVEDLFYRLYPMFRNFPQVEKYAICVEIKRSFVRALNFLTVAEKVKSLRIYHLQKTEASVIDLMTLLKLCRKQTYISAGFFKEADLILSTISVEISDVIRGKPKPKASVQNLKS